MSHHSPGAGWFESFRSIGESSLALLRSRFELFTVEIQEEKLRLLHLLAWICVAAAFGFAGIVLAIITLAFGLWAAAGFAGLIGLAVATLAVALGILWGIRKSIQTGPPPFSQTVAEFRKDGECLRNNK